MKLRLLVLITTAAICSAAEKPTIYNHVGDERSELDGLVIATFAPKFTIVDVRDSGDYVRPQIKAGHLPRTARTEAGESLGGYVLVAYVITKEGRVSEPVVLKSADERLNSIAMKAMEDWRFAPATLKGTAISTTAAQEFTFESTPTDYVLQVLEPTGGTIPRPKDWFYSEAHRGPVYMWTLSREDSTGNKRYTTGVRIQTFADLKAATGKNAKQFILDFVAAKKKEATKVIKSCDEEDQGLFTRICLETEEGPNHILYSLFWGSSGMDLAVISIAGTTKELWETYAPTFDKMSAFELIDMKRFDPALKTGQGFETERLVLYQDDAALKSRLPTVPDFANYIKQLQSVCTEFFATAKTPETLHVVVAIRSGKRARVWFISSTRPSPDPERESLRKKLEAIPPCEVHGGPVAFAIAGKLAGGDGKNPQTYKNFRPPIPKEWQDAAFGKENVLLPDGFLDLVWPDKP